MSEVLQKQYYYFNLNLLFFDWLDSSSEFEPIKNYTKSCLMSSPWDRYKLITLTNDSIHTYIDFVDVIT